MTHPIQFFCKDNNVVKIEDDELLKCSARLEADLTPEARATRKMIGLNIDSIILLRIVQWAKNSWRLRVNSGGLTTGPNGFVLFTNWEKRFLTSCSKLMPQLLHASIYLRIDQLYLTIQRWILQLTYVAKPHLIDAPPGLNNLVSVINIVGVSVEQASEEIKVAAKKSCVIGANGCGDMKFVLWCSSDTEELIKKIYLENVKLKQNLQTKNVALDNLKKAHNELQGKTYLLEQQIINLKKEKASLERKETFLKDMRECYICGSLLKTEDMLASHLMNDHEFME